MRSRGKDAPQIRIPAWIRKQARTDLDGVPPHRAHIAQWRLACLDVFWKADEAAGGQHRTATRHRVVKQIRATAPQIRISLTTLYRWEMTWRIGGLGGLVGLYGDHIGERPPHFVKLGEEVVRKIEPQLAKLAELGLAVCEQNGDEPKGAGWFVWKPLRPALRSWLKMIVQRESPRFRARGSRSSRRRLAG